MTAGRILLVGADDAVAGTLRAVLEPAGYMVRTVGSAASALAEVERAEWDLALVDLARPAPDGAELLREVRARRPRLPAVVLTAPGTAARGVVVREAGATDFLESPGDLTPGRIRTVVDNALERKRLLDRLGDRAGYGALVGRSAAMQPVFELLDRLASVDTSVLVVGEPGTGKALAAQVVHYGSPRGGGPFVRVDCAVGPIEWLEATLFGARPGAAGEPAGGRRGLLEAAHRGSLFLDEVVELPAELQVRLVRVLTEGAGTGPAAASGAAVDVRLLGATRRDPEAALREGRLRPEFHARLAGVTLRLPPLRERPEDIPLLARHFLGQAAARHGRPVAGIAADADRALLGYAWPGNVRELEQAIEHAVLVARGRELAAADLPEAVARERPPGAAPAGGAALPTLNLEALEREAIWRALEATRWNKQAAAGLLGLHRPTLYSKMRKHGIPQKRPGA